MPLPGRPCGIHHRRYIRCHLYAGNPFCNVPYIKGKGQNNEKNQRDKIFQIAEQIGKAVALQFRRRNFVEQFLHEAEGTTPAADKTRKD